MDLALFGKSASNEIGNTISLDCTKRCFNANQAIPDLECIKNCTFK